MLWETRWSIMIYEQFVDDKVIRLKRFILPLEEVGIQFSRTTKPGLV